jgi:excisionase family DNA binding protein
MDLLDVDEVARAVKLRPHNVYNLAKRGMPCYRTGARVRFHLPEVLAWMKQQADARTAAYVE